MRGNEHQLPLYNNGRYQSLLLGHHRAWGLACRDVARTEVHMTISDRINDQVNRLDLQRLTDEESEWLHYVQSLIQWAYISKFRREQGYELV
jgi:hypothetical protein